MEKLLHSLSYFLYLRTGKKFQIQQYLVIA